jgi:signal transduction histidine kinase
VNDDLDLVSADEDPPRRPAADEGRELDAPLRELVSRLARAEQERDRLLAERDRARDDAAAARDDLRVGFLRMAAHELRTPLQTAGLQLGVALARLEARGELPEGWMIARLVRAQRALGRMQRLIDGMLDLADLAGGRFELRPERVELGALVRGVVERTREGLASAGCRCEVRTAGPVDGEWDRARLETAVDQLLSNAMKHAAGSAIAVTVAAGDGAASICVRDGGPGIPECDQARLFGRFERVRGRPDVPGMGLGLAVVRAVAEAHGGSVCVDSAPGRGAAFTVTLPR